MENNDGGEVGMVVERGRDLINVVVEGGDPCTQFTPEQLEQVTTDLVD